MLKTAEILTTHYPEEGQVYGILDGLPDGFFTKVKFTFVAGGLNLSERSIDSEQEFADACLRRKFMPTVSVLRRFRGSEVDQQYKMPPTQTMPYPATEDAMRDLISQDINHIR